MNSINNILNNIEKITNEKINKMDNEYIKKCKDIANNFNILIEEEQKKYSKKLLTKKKLLKTNFEADLKQFEKEKILKTKEEILTKTINFALKKICDEKELYFNIIKKLLQKNLPLNNCKIVFGEKYYDILKEYCNNKNFKIDIEKSQYFDYGFKIVCKKYIMDFTLENIFLENIPKLKIKASTALSI